MAEHESSLAVLVDFENMARPGAKGRGDFDIHLVLNRLAEKGRVIVKRAYADWSRYRDARHELQNAGLGLIEMPSAREGAKNRADIQMAVDAMELAYSREHVDNFVIVSGDSDFTPLVGKLRELNKRVIGVGNRESASELLIANCDEFIFYDLLAANSGAGRRGATSRHDPVDLLRETLTALQREGVEWPLASVVKDSMRRKYPAFDESEHGYSTFSKFLEDASGTGIVRLETDPRSGTYRVELADGRAAAAPPPAVAAAEAERAPEEGEGRRRRRRRRSEAAGAAPVQAVGAAEVEAEVFEVVVTPTPDAELGTLPPPGEPISYEDMIMLGPEIGEDVPELVEMTDVPGSDEPPSRSSRRRRRRAAVAEPEPTVADLEPIEPEEALAPATGTGAPAGEEEPLAPAAAAATEPAGEEETAEEAPVTTGRRRVRRRVAAPAEEPAAEAETPAQAEAEAAVEGAPKPKRRARKKAEEPVAEAEAPAEAEGAEEAPKPKRRTRKKAEEPAAEEEAPKPKRRIRKKAEEPSAEAEAPAEAEGAEEAPKPKRRTRKKAEEPAETPA